MRKLSALLLALLTVVLGATWALATEHVVRKGETLFGIAKHYQLLSWKVLYEANREKIGDNPNRIKVGLELSIPKSESGSKTKTGEKLAKLKSEKTPRPVSITQEELDRINAKNSWWAYEIPLNGNPKEIKRLGTKPYKGEIFNQIRSFAFPPEVEKALLNKIKRGDGQLVRIPFGEVLEAINYGHGGMMYSTAIVDKRSLTYEAVEFQVEYFGFIYRFAHIDDKWCGNWARRTRIPTPKKERLLESPQLEVEDKSQLELPIIRIIEDGDTVLEHQPIVGAWFGRNDLSGWWGAYGEYVAYLRKDNGLGGFQLGWAPGVGFFAIYGEGESFTSSYGWQEYGLGPQIAAKYVAEDWQFEAKLRLIHEWMRGSNNSGYWMNQWGWKLGVYAEVVKDLDDERKWKWMAMAEAWFPLSYSVSSSWHGQEVQDRFQASLLFGIQRKLTDEVSVRFLAGPFHQGWDDLTGIRAQLELRFNFGYEGDVLMLGPHVAFYPFGLSAGVSAASLFTWGGFVRAELGPIIQDEWRKNKMAEVNLKTNPFAMP